MSSHDLFVNIASGNQNCCSDNTSNRYTTMTAVAVTSEIIWINSGLLRLTHIFCWCDKVFFSVFDASLILACPWEASGIQANIPRLGALCLALRFHTLYPRSRNCTLNSWEYNYDIFPVGLSVGTWVGERYQRYVIHSVIHEEIEGLDTASVCVIPSLASFNVVAVEDGRARLSQTGLTPAELTWSLSVPMGP